MEIGTIGAGDFGQAFAKRSWPLRTVAPLFGDHSISDTKIASLPNFALQSFRSVSVTSRAREQAPQEKTGMCLATILSRISERGRHPTGNIAAAVTLAHEVGCFSGKENLHLMTRVGL